MTTNAQRSVERDMRIATQRQIAALSLSPQLAQKLAAAIQRSEEFLRNGRVRPMVKALRDPAVRQWVRDLGPLSL